MPTTKENTMVITTDPNATTLFLDGNTDDDATSEEMIFTLDGETPGETEGYLNVSPEFALEIENCGPLGWQFSICRASDMTEFGRGSIPQRTLVIRPSLPFRTQEAIVAGLIALGRGA